MFMAQISYSVPPEIRAMKPNDMHSYSDPSNNNARIKEVTPSLSVRTIKAVTTIQNQLKEAVLEKQLRKRERILSIKFHTGYSNEPLPDVI